MAINQTGPPSAFGTVTMGNFAGRVFRPLSRSVLMAVCEDWMPGSLGIQCLVAEGVMASGLARISQELLGSGDAGFPCQWQFRLLMEA